MNIGDQVVTPTGKEGTVLRIFRTRECLEDTVTPRVLVLITCAITPTECVFIRAAYHPRDLEDAHAASHA